MSSAGRRTPPVELRLDLRGRLALTLPEVARALGVSERHMRELRAELPCVTLGRRVVVPLDDLRAWLRNRAETERGSRLEAVKEVLCSLRDE